MPHHENIGSFCNEYIGKQTCSPLNDRFLINEFVTRCSGHCTLCDSSGDYCDFDDGVAQKMTFMVFAVVAGALWGTM